MSRSSVSVEVDAPPEAVWRVVADPRNLPAWDRHIRSVRGVPSGGLQKGSRYRTEIRFMGIRTTIEAEVLEIDPPREATVRLSGLLEATVRSRVTALDHGRSRLEHQIHFRLPGGPLGRLAAQALRLTGGAAQVLKRGTMAQKRQVEGTRR
jgi:uncharacterized membrane protein